MMENLAILLQIIVALGLLNVWLVRFNRKTDYRGGGATSMREEFSAYGLPPSSLHVVGALKILGAVALIAGIWIPETVLPAAVVIALLMLGAVAMHLKVNDPAKKFLPAATVLILTLAIIVLRSL